jgi:hypothetical protein
MVRPVVFTLTRIPVFVVMAVCFEERFAVKVKAKVSLRQTISRPVRHGVRRPSGTRYQFFFLLEIYFRQLLFVIL